MTYNKIMGFSLFEKMIINENEGDNVIFDVTEIRNGEGYDIHVVDAFNDSSAEDINNKIIIDYENGTSIKICFVNNSGKKSEAIWIPKNGCTIKKDNDIIKEIILDPNKKWINIISNKNKIDDFIEDYIDNMERAKSNNSFEILIRDEIEILLDILNIDGDIKEIVKKDDIYEVELDNGIFIELSKRSNKDLFSKFKIYVNSNSSKPAICIDNTKNKNIRIAIDDMDIDLEFTGINLNTSKNKANAPYLNYLFKRAINKESPNEQDALLNYYKKIIGFGNKDYTKIKIIKKLLSEYMNEKDIENIK